MMATLTDGISPDSLDTQTSALAESVQECVGVLLSLCSNPGQIFQYNSPTSGVKDPRREAKFRDRYQSVVDSVTLLVVLSLIGLQIFRGMTADSVGDTTSLRNFGIALAVLVGVGVYYTPLWQPALYLVGAVLAGTLTVFWGLRTPVTVSLEAGRLLFGSALFVFCIYQFFRARFQQQVDQGESHSEAISGQNRG